MRKAERPTTLLGFKRKPKNRRFEREHLLDVKIESRQRRALRFRFLGKLVTGCLGIAAFLAAAWFGTHWLLDRAVFKNPAFAVQAIDIETNGILPKNLIRTCAGVHVGNNLMALDLNRIQRDLEFLPWIRSAAVERVRPHMLRIRVIEREPIAQTSLFEPGGPDGAMQNVVFYFDADGYVMLPLEAHRLEAAASSFDRLPVLTGVAGTELLPGRAVESKQIQAALRLVVEFGRSPMLGLADLRSVDLSVPDLLQASTGQGATITFGLSNLDMQLRRWRLVHDFASSTGRRLASLDLSVSNNVPARWLDISGASPPPPTPGKPSPYRKKHV